MNGKKDKCADKPKTSGPKRGSTPASQKKGTKPPFPGKKNK